MWLFVITMRPLYVLLDCLDRYKPGTNFSMELSETSVQEFRKLNIAAQSAIERSEKIFEEIYRDLYESNKDKLISDS